MTATELAAVLRDAPARPVPAAEVEAVLAELKDRGKVAARCILESAGARRPTTDSMRTLLAHARARLTAYARSVERNSV